MLVAICFALFVPLAGFLVLFLGAPYIGRRLAGFIACLTIFISFICFLSLFYAYLMTDMNAETFSLFDWVPVQGINADFSIYLDPLSLLMALIITGVGFLIHVYSIGYMEHDEDIPRYFACMNFFVFAMLLLVLAGNLLLLFVGWEGVGLASYLLIGFWYQRPSAARAATKAFVVNRIGDAGLLIGLLLTFHLFGTSDISEISERVQQGFRVGAPLLTLLTLLYFWGAIGKSAQLPLYTWLPDAMEGPTPVSALIHAATMVTAGVYLVVRMHSLFILSPLALNIVGVVGGVTSLFAALSATAQTDLKRVLAYSTISQLGLMFLACGVGAFYAAMFHLTTHAFIKALLFLSAGNVIHMLHDITDMNKMGGLAKVFNKTNWLFLIGVLALSGIPPFAAFFSKDLILEQEYVAGYHTLFYIGLLASILTAFYLTRAYCLTFLGKSHVDENTLKTTQEAPPVMLVPVTILAFFAIIGGALGCTYCNTPFLENFLAKADVTLFEPEPHFVLTPEIWMAIIGALLGVGVAGWMYTKWIDRLGHSILMLKKSFFVNEIYWKFIAQPLQAVARFIANVFEPEVFDRSIEVTTRATQGAARWLQQVQSGQIRSYIAWMVMGVVLLIVYFVF